MTERIFRLARMALIALGLGLIVLNIVLGEAVNITLPLVFLMLGAGALLMVFAVSRTSLWGALFYIPAGLLLAFGLVFLINVITNDWAAWAYAWMLLVAGAGAGVALTARQMGWQRLVFLIGVGAAAVGVTLFALFGAITGGLFIQVMAPILLVMGGLALYWIKPEWIGKRERLGVGGEAERGLGIGGLGIGEEKIGDAPGVTEALVEPVSAREMEVLRLIELGLSNAEIAGRLGLANSTVKSHINNLYGKLGVQTRVQALNRARELGLL